jgi:hypothetical protein
LLSTGIFLHCFRNFKNLDFVSALLKKWPELNLKIYRLVYLIFSWITYFWN